MKLPTQKILTDEGMNTARIQPDFYVNTRQMAMSDEFQIALKMAVQNVKNRYQISHDIQHLAAQAMVSHVAINDLVEEIYDVFVNPPYVSTTPHSNSDFAEEGDDNI